MPSAARHMTSYHGVVLTAWALLILTLSTEQFWYCWSTLP
jgi:hypothetical protein